MGWRDTIVSDWRLLSGNDPVLEDASLAEYTSFRIGGPADVLAMPRRLHRLASLLLSAHRHGVPVTLLGAGSNVLISDKGIRGLVVINRCRRYAFLGEEEAGRPFVWAEAGVSLARLARAAIQMGLDGLTWAVTVPGTVGGAAVGNAGAHGGAMADVVAWVTLLYADGTVERVGGEDLCYGYRTSALKEARQRGEPFPMVLDVTLRLWRGDAAVLRQRADIYLVHRRRTQPAKSSAGSVFRNPPGDYAGRLIEAAGLKGSRVGNAVVSSTHANFIVNEGKATAQDVVRLMRLVQQRVYERFGVMLMPEILFLGEWNGHPDDLSVNAKAVALQGEGVQGPCTGGR